MATIGRYEQWALLIVMLTAVLLFLCNKKLIRRCRVVFVIKSRQEIENQTRKSKLLSLPLMNESKISWWGNGGVWSSWRPVGCSDSPCCWWWHSCLMFVVAMVLCYGNTTASSFPQRNPCRDQTSQVGKVRLPTNNNVNLKLLLFHHQMPSQLPPTLADL